MRCDRLTNNLGMSLSMAVWLADDPYDYVDIPNYISITTLMKHPRQIILGSRLTSNVVSQDVSEAMSSRLGSAIHSSIEDVWLNRAKACLKKLGYPATVIERVLINPEPADLYEGCIPVYMEKRSLRKIGKWTIGGKFDFVGDGKLEDFKSTSVFYYMNGNNDVKYTLQGSLYRWLNPEIITDDYLSIQFIFTDWSKSDARYKDGYPPSRIYPRKYRLTSLPETELWVQRKLALLEELWDAPESELPLCDAEALWQDPPTYKYYKNPAKMNRSTRNFDTMAEANLRWIEDGRVGIVVEAPGNAKGCVYCDSYKICSQKDSLIANGTLKV